MTSPPKKPSRAATLSHLEATSHAALGSDSALDAAFAAFDRVDTDTDPERMRAAAAHLRQLLAAPPGHTAASAALDASALGKG